MKQINSVLLVEDNEITNFYNKHLFTKNGYVTDVQIATNGKKALDYLKGVDINSKPALILLDLNMPVMNGFEFLDEFEKLEEELREGIIICILTTSLHEEDLEKAKDYAFISQYCKKPLSASQIKNILTAYF
ncbi:MAG: response regulator [Chitinophagales bacterium]